MRSLRMASRAWAYLGTANMANNSVNNTEQSNTWLSRGSLTGSARRERGVDVIPHALPGPLRKRHPHNLLRRTSALDRPRRVRENRPPPLEPLDVPPHLLHRLRRVDGRHLGLRVPQRVGQAGDAGEVGLEPGGDDEVVVGDVQAFGGEDGVVGGVEGGDGVGVVLDALGDDGGGWALHVLEGLQAGADEGPAGLVELSVYVHDGGIR